MKKYNQKNKNIVVLTGAGLSAESGIKTFRDSNGLWENHAIEDVASYEGFLRNPKLVLDFYNQRRRQLFQNDIKPNKAHSALAKLQNESLCNVLLVTQNVDNLLERSNAKEVIHMHGELVKIRCENCNEIFYWEEDIYLETSCPNCDQKKYLRPHIVWFGEIPLYMDKIENHLRKCDLFLSIGTSGEVYPAAQFVNMAKRSGAYTIEINLTKTSNRSYFNETIQGKATEVLDKWVNNFLS